jgi:hypothetical protein
MKARLFAGRSWRHGAVNGLEERIERIRHSAHHLSVQYLLREVLSVP